MAHFELDTSPFWATLTALVAARNPPSGRRTKAVSTITDDPKVEQYIPTPKRSLHRRAHTSVMTFRTRAIRIVLPEARGQLANTLIELVNVSRTGALIRAGYELWPGSVWPFVLELPTETLNLIARVARCSATEASAPDEPVSRSAEGDRR